jgi:hypothetical protein
MIFRVFRARVHPGKETSSNSRSAHSGQNPKVSGHSALAGVIAEESSPAASAGRARGDRPTDGPAILKSHPSGDWRSFGARPSMTTHPGIVGG